MDDKEKIYDEQVAPLMSQIIQICKKEGLPMFALFNYDDGAFVKTLIGVNKDSHPLFTMLEALSQCPEGGGVNIDKFILWIISTYPNGSSAFLHLLDHKVEGR